MISFHYSCVFIFSIPSPYYTQTRSSESENTQYILLELLAFFFVSNKFIIYFLAGYFQGMLRESFHKTLYWLSKSHKNLTSSSEHLLKELFRDMEGYVGDSTIDVRKSIDQFFKESFPLLYIYLLPAGKTPTSSYKKCLMDKFDAIQPFGNKPEEFSKTLIEKLSPVQILLRSLVFSAKVITTAKEFNFTSECSVSLLKMNYCPLCQGVNDIKPCHGFCMDLLRKCLATEIQLQVDWDDYIKSLVFLTDALSKSDLQDFTSEMYKYLLNAATSVLIYKETLLPKVCSDMSQGYYMVGRRYRLLKENCTQKMIYF